MKWIRSAVLLSFLGLHACHQSDPATEVEIPDPIDATVLTLTVRDLPVHEQVVGTVQPELRATISSKVLGRIIRMEAVPGQTVETGAQLASIETPQLEAALKRAEATLANAAREAERFRKVRESGSQSVSEREIDQIEATLEINTAERDLIQSQLADATVRAPFAGRITHKLRDTGDLVQPGTPILEIEDPTRLRFEIHLAESLAAGLSLGARFPVRIESAQKDLTGTVSEISPAADTGSRTFLVKLDLPTSTGLLAGQFGRAFIPRGLKTAIVIPVEALTQRGQMHLVAVADAGDRSRLRIVRTGEARDGQVEILAGLEAGERIVSPLPEGLESGVPLRLAP